MSLRDITSELMTVLMRSTDAEYAAAALLQFKKDVLAEEGGRSVTGDEIYRSGYNTGRMHAGAAPTLTAAERKLLSFALDQAAEEMSLGDGFTADDEAALRSLRCLAESQDAAPDFFAPGRTYAYQADGFTAPELLTVFRVATTTTHPATGEPFAFGWIRKGETTTWQPYAEPGTEWPHAWTEITEESAR